MTRLLVPLITLVFLGGCCGSDYLADAADPDRVAASEMLTDAPPHVAAPADQGSR